MEPSAVTSLQEGFQDLYVLNWPIDVPAEDASAGLCQVIMKRPGDLLLGVPPGLIPPEALQGAATQGEDALLGPHKVLAVPAVIVAEGGDVVPDEDMDVQVVDVSMEVVQSLRLFSPEADEEEPMITFGLDKSVLPNPAILLSFAKEWRQVTGQGKTVFYSAEEGPEGPEAPFPKVAKAKQKAKPGEKAKKPSPQQVAEQIQHIASVLPAITDTLASIQEEQRRIKYVVEGQSLSPPPRPTQAPVSMSMQAFANLMQQPPKTRGVEHLPHPPPRPHRMQLDSPLDAQGQAEENPPCGGELKSGVGSSGTEPGPYKSGEPVVIRRSTFGCTINRGLDVVKRSPRQGEAAEGIGRPEERVLPDSHAGCLQEVEACFSSPVIASGDSCQRLLNADISRTFRRLRRSKRHGGHAVCPQLHFGLRDQRGSGGSPRICSSSSGRPRTGGSGSGEVGLGVSVDVAGRPPQPDVELQRGGVPQTGRARAFAPLCPQRWATVALAYSREIDFIQNKRLELGKRPPAPSAQGPGPTRSQRGRSSRKQKEEETEEHSQQKMQPPKLRVPTSGSAGMSLTEFFYVRACHWRCLQREGTTSRPCWAGVWQECRCWECYIKARRAL